MRGGLEQEDWAMYYARYCSPVNRLMSRRGLWKIDWCVPENSHSLTRKVPSTSNRRSVRVVDDLESL